MCGRYTIISMLERIQKAFELPDLTADEEIETNYYVLPGENVPVISSSTPNKITLMRFGFTPSWGEKKHFAINARAEGDLNIDNTTNYKNEMGILNKPFFRNAIRSRRCLVIADAIIEGSKEKKLKEPYLIFPRNKKRPFAMAGIWEEWLNPKTNQLESGFAIITSYSNQLMQDINYHRCPVVIPTALHKEWLNIHAPVSNAIKLLLPFDHQLWNAYQIDPEKMKSKSLEGIMPISDPIYSE